MRTGAQEAAEQGCCATGVICKRLPLERICLSIHQALVWILIPLPLVVRFYLSDFPLELSFLACKREVSVDPDS